MEKAAPDFTFPEVYSFPPFFTLQPVAASRDKQLRMWSELVLAYCAHHKIDVIDVGTALASPLFANQSIGRMCRCCCFYCFPRHDHHSRIRCS